MDHPYVWLLVFAIVAFAAYIAVVVVRAARLRREHDAHLARHGIAGTARVVDVQRSNFSVNNRRGWSLILVWRDPHTGTDHRLESDLIWEPGNQTLTPPARLFEIGELPVRVDPKAPEKYHQVDISSVPRSAG